MGATIHIRPHLLTAPHYNDGSPNACFVNHPRSTVGDIGEAA
jgi:hypothetical protein